MITSSERVDIWPELLKQISQEVLNDPDFIDNDWHGFVSPAQKESGWLGFLGAAESDLQALEQRLGVPLPPSYRAFLAASNGFGPVDCFIWRLFPVAEIDWLVNKDKEIVEIWEQDDDADITDEQYFDPESRQDARYTRSRYFRRCLMVSDWGDAGFLALNPAVENDGEWEAWHFANWHPGAVRYHSFIDLMQQTLENYRELKKPDY
ncbi:SMI1/KNR4 family protein [Hymenobacter sp. DH14]|uniref:SMI1/KNR4 family protein n=1 Tax=Hymenobacter cyanobacteriorum TaxID=2926463 RepID=A0A9X1VHU4_9BACT|nr:SMI1/KNR4 family protein [Hymenobacter cyanobacteriorum]MCI1189057.1 SMI1/KNR4 family protein [Hymenobacter cyanobacteriorum]